MGNETSNTLVEDSTPPSTLSDRSLAAVADLVKSGKIKRIVAMTGAGISTAAGIPDFRSPETGLYANLQRLKLPYAEAVFDIGYFRENPEPFYVLAKELYPGKFRPTISHCFLALLEKKGLLSMLFTQNIDCLERDAGVPADKICEAHGSFASQRCIDCKAEYPHQLMRLAVETAQVPRCLDEECHGLVKPNIVFFGEPLPGAFDRDSVQVVKADLVLILGTSLKVFPFAGLPQMARDRCPRVLFNLERVGSLGTRADDVLCLGPCDAGIRELAAELGWADELEAAWGALVGDEEAEKQRARQSGDGRRLRDEVQELSDSLEAALMLGGDAGAGPAEASADAGDLESADKSEPDARRIHIEIQEAGTAEADDAVLSADEGGGGDVARE